MMLVRPPTKKSIAAVTRGSKQRMAAFAASASERWATIDPRPSTVHEVPERLVVRHVSGGAEVSKRIFVTCGVCCMRVEVRVGSENRGVWLISYTYEAEGDVMVEATHHGGVIDCAWTCVREPFVVQTRAFFWTTFRGDDPLSLAICGIGRVGRCELILSRSGSPGPLVARPAVHG